MIDAVRATDQPAAALLSWHQSPSRLPITCGWCPLHPHHIFTARCGRHWPGCKVSPVRVSLVGRAGESTSEVCDVRRGSSGSLQHITPTISAAPDILVWPTFLRPTTPTASAASDVELDGPICLQRPPTASAASDSFLVRPTVLVS